MCRRKKQNLTAAAQWLYFVSKVFFTSGLSSFCRAPTWRSCRHQRAKLPSSWLERASKWKHSANADFSAPLQHRGICWISSRLAISFYLTIKSQRAVRAAVGPRRRGPAGLEWSWERTAKLLLPPSALRRARGSCHRPCGWGSEHKTHQATRYGGEYETACLQTLQLLTCLLFFSRSCSACEPRIAMRLVNFSISLAWQLPWPDS